MSQGVPHSRDDDLLHLSWLEARGAGRSPREIAETVDVSAATISNVISSIRNRDLEAIKSQEIPLEGDLLQAELEDHAAKYWPKKRGL